MKEKFLRNIAKIGKYTAEQGAGWPTFWGFHEMPPSREVKSSGRKKGHYMNMGWNWRLYRF